MNFIEEVDIIKEEDTMEELIVSKGINSTEGIEVTGMKDTIKGMTDMKVENMGGGGKRRRDGILHKL